ncbi:MAG: glycosyltransferase family 4 protein [Muribaculaceae bacterium]|nr:glycosyltransferase family 4 protein [Muribaculaceae bacterium]
MESKNRIVIVSCVFPPEPLVSARISEAIAERLSKDMDVVVLCPAPTRPVGRLWSRDTSEYLNYEVVTLDSYTCPESKIFGRFKESYSFGKAVARYVSDNHDSIKAIYANTHPTFGQYLLLKAAEKYDIPCIVHIQDLYPESLTSKLGIIGRAANEMLVKFDARHMRKARKLIAISGDMKTALAMTRNYSPDNIEVIYNWQDERKFLKHRGPTDSGGKFTFMFLGNINPTANIPTVIHAFGRLGNKDSRLIIAGSGAEKPKCMEIASSYPESEIIFRDVLPDEVPSVQSQADVLLLPLLKGISRTAMPSKLPAYMFSAKPVLACVEADSDVGRAITESECGWISEPEDITALSKIMEKCIGTPRRQLLEMGDKGKAFGIKKFSTEVNLGKICNLIKNLSDGSENIITG